MSPGKKHKIFRMTLAHLVNSAGTSANSALPVIFSRFTGDYLRKSADRRRADVDVPRGGALHLPLGRGH
jgi:hypothetical protein